MALPGAIVNKLAAFAAAAAMLLSCGCGGSIKEAVTSLTETAAVSAEKDTSAEKNTSAAETSKTEEINVEDYKDKKVIALTFDDGPNTTTTNEILDLIEQYGIKASFYVIGQNINDESAKAMKRAHDLGCEIDSHSYTHSYMNEMTAEQIKDEMDKTAQLIYDTVGEYPKFFRPPYIAINSTMYDTIDLPFISGIGCNDYDDNVTVERRVMYVTKKCGDGCIILLHDAKGNSKTVEALKEIIPFFLNEGYTFVTTEELFKAKGITPSADKEIIYSYATETGWQQ